MNLSGRGSSRGGRGPPGSVPRYPGVRMYRGDDFRRDNRGDDHRRQGRFNNNDDEEGDSYGSGGNSYYNNNNNNRFVGKCHNLTHNFRCIQFLLYVM